jgi:hypothetical protein
MRIKIISTVIILVICCGSALGQNTLKLFDATAITPSSTAFTWNPRTPMIFAQMDVYLSCPVGGGAQSYLTGPNNGSLIVDNFLTVNGNNVCPDEWNCFAGILAPPYTAVGLPMDSAYVGVAPLDVSSQITGSGAYTFVLSDYGFDYGNSEIYLHTTCSFGTYVCHHNSGRFAHKTLAVGTDAVAAHLAHGDTVGPCEN